MSKTDRSPAQHKAKQRVYLQIPDNITLVMGVTQQGEVLEAYEPGDPEIPEGWQSKEIEFVRDFMRRFVLADQSWGKEMDRIYMAMDLRSTFHGKVATDWVELSKDEHEAICDVVRKPGKGYTPALAVHFAPWFRAILDATDKLPTEETDSELDGVGTPAPS